MYSWFQMINKVLLKYSCHLCTVYDVLTIGANTHIKSSTITLAHLRKKKFCKDINTVRDAVYDKIKNNILQNRI